MMNPSLREVVQAIRKELSRGYPDREGDVLTMSLIQFLTGYSRMEVFLKEHTEAPEGLASAWPPLVERLLLMEPLQYVLGTADFCGRLFSVGPSVLIPRPETEELMGWVLEESEPRGRVLDVGTGSGCLAITLSLQWPEAKVDAVDVSAAALELARKNGVRHGSSVRWVQGDFLHHPEAFVPEPLYDIIVSNPPYVSRGQKAAMNGNVLEYEPHQALFPPGEDVLVFYKALAAFASGKLSPGGAIYVELNEAYAEETAAVFVAAGLSEVELRRDIRDKWRMCKAGRAPHG